MGTGKLPVDSLNKILEGNLGRKRKEVLQGAGIGIDSALVDFGENICAISTDPITGSSKNLGSLAVNISCNDVASSGAKPIGVLLTILAPLGSKDEELEDIMADASEEARNLNIEIIGGHTEITDAVNRMVVSSTVIGKQKKKQVLEIDKVEVGDKILVSKSIGIEGTSILANELEDFLLKEFDKDFIVKAQRLAEDISVVKEGLLAGELGVKYMHDITEGGVLGAVWEASKAIKQGVKIYEDQLPVEKETLLISNFLGIDYRRLISSGSMLIICSDKTKKELEKVLKEHKITLTEIGEVTERDILLVSNGKAERILEPKSDELYKALNKFS